ncbi:MAG: extracellular solute-binding protein [Geminicoccaceae bacterium]
MANLNPIAEANGWNDVVPAALQKFRTYDGKWVAAPVNVHSTNWVWSNKVLMDELGIEQPQTWDDLCRRPAEGQGSGHVALAHGGQARRMRLFDGGGDVHRWTCSYQKAFIDLDTDTLGSTL